MPRKTGSANRYGYDPKGDTVRVRQHDVARLLPIRRPRTGQRPLLRNLHPATCRLNEGTHSLFPIRDAR
jgi:hypothetical protein